MVNDGRSALVVVAPYRVYYGEAGNMIMSVASDEDLAGRGFLIFSPRHIERTNSCEHGRYSRLRCTRPHLR